MAKIANYQMKDCYGYKNINDELQEESYTEKLYEFMVKSDFIIKYNVYIGTIIFYFKQFISNCRNSIKAYNCNKKLTFDSHLNPRVKRNGSK